MYVKPDRPPDVVGEAIARATAGRTWTGSTAELLAAVNAVATEAEREDRAWSRSPAALATALRSTTDTLRAHGLRLSVMPADILIEPIPAMVFEPMPNGTRPSRKAA